MLTAPDRKSRFLGYGDIDVSFEFFPPRTAAMEETLWRSIRRLEPLRPSYVSVTYGAGGSTRERTHATVARVLEGDAAEACGSSHPALTRRARGGRRRDPRLLGHRCPPYRGAARRPRRRRGPTLCADAWRLYQCRGPHARHQEASRPSTCRSPAIRRSIQSRRPSMPISTCFWQKIDAGASTAITQFFFDNEVYFRYLDRVRDRGITIPIVPGIIPIHNFKQVSGFAAKIRCQRALSGSATDLKVWMRTRRPATRCRVAVAAEQVMGLVDRGITEFHFLHAEPRRPRLRHLPSLGLASGSDGQCPRRRPRNDPRTTHRSAARQAAKAAHPDPRWRHGHHDPALQARTRRAIADALQETRPRSQGQQRSACAHSSRRSSARSTTPISEAGADILETNTFNAQAISQSDYGLADDRS